MAVQKLAVGQDTAASGWMTPASIGSGADHDVPLNVMASPLASTAAQKCELAQDTCAAAAGASTRVCELQELPFQREANTPVLRLPMVTQNTGDVQDTEVR